MVTGLLQRVEHFWDGLLDQRHDETVLRVSALLLMLYPPDGEFFKLWSLTLSIPMVLDGRAARSRWMWTLLALNCLASSWLARYSQDNHKYLLLYWTTACCLATWSRQALQMLLHNGRLLLALVFTFAASWKLIGGQVLNGDFFEWAFLTDPRFSGLNGLLTGIDRAALALNRSSVELMRALPSDGLTIPLATSSGVEEAAVALGWGMTLIEAAIALTFWAAFVRRWSDVQDWILILFCMGTYTLTPVAGFGTTLAVMGLAQVPEERRDVRELYLWTLIFVQFARMPSFDFIQRLIG